METGIERHWREEAEKQEAQSQQEIVNWRCPTCGQRHPAYLQYAQQSNNSYANYLYGVNLAGGLAAGYFL